MCIYSLNENEIALHHVVIITMKMIKEKVNVQEKLTHKDKNDSPENFHGKNQP